MSLKDRNTGGYSAWTIGNGDPMHGVRIPHSIPWAGIMQESSNKSGRKNVGGNGGEKSQTRPN